MALDVLREIKLNSVIATEDRQILMNFLNELERTTGYFYSLCVFRPTIAHPRPHYQSTVHIGGLGFRGPIQVTMIDEYRKLSGIYTCTNEFERKILEPLRTDTFYPFIEFGLLAGPIFQRDNPIKLTVEIFTGISTKIIGKIQFIGDSTHLNGIKIGTMDKIPPEYLPRLKEMIKDFQLYWVQGIDNCSDLLHYNGLNPDPAWSEIDRIMIFERMIQRSCKMEFTSEQWTRYFDQKSVTVKEPSALFQRFVNDLNPGVALDIGCGVGVETGYLINKGWEVDAIDPLPIEKYVRARIEDQTKLNLISGDITDNQILAQLRSSYDVIISLGTLPFLSDLAAVRATIADIYSRLREGGLFIVSFLGANHEWNGKYKALFLSVEEITDLINSAPFEIVDLETFQKAHDGGNGMANVEYHTFVAIK